MLLLIGLGNPGAHYEKTRHNLGWRVVQAFVKRHGGSFKRAWKLKGKLAEVHVGDQQVAALLPSTYMNLSGEAVRRLVNRYKASCDQLIVVVDEVYLRLGTLRLRAKGSSGGHNGLKSIESELGTQDYSRLKMGIGLDGDLDEPLEDFVLSPFSTEEEDEVEAAIERGVEVLEEWIESMKQTDD